jgi:hypothetical protein
MLKKTESCSRRARNLNRRYNTSIKISLHGSDQSEGPDML